MKNNELPIIKKRAKMSLDTSAWVRIIVSSILIATLIFALKRISPLNPEWIYMLINLCIVALLNRPESIKDSIIAGALIGLLTGVILSVFYLSSIVLATIFFIVFGIIGMLISYVIGKSIAR